jgi:hypothetical protein
MLIDEIIPKKKAVEDHNRSTKVLLMSIEPGVER